MVRATKHIITLIILTENEPCRNTSDTLKQGQTLFLVKLQVFTVRQMFPCKVKVHPFTPGWNLLAGQH